MTNNEPTEFDKQVVDRLATAIERTFNRAKREYGVTANQCGSASAVVLMREAIKAGTPMKKLPEWLRLLADELEADQQREGGLFNMPAAGSA